MQDKISYLYSNDTHNAFAEPMAPIQVERVREWSGIERIVNNHLLAGLGAARRQAPQKKKRAPGGQGQSVSAPGLHAATGTWSHG